MQKMNEEQRKFATEHHNLVYSFLRKKDLDINTYYDIVIFGFLEAVQDYHLKLELKKYSFSTIAWRNMLFSLYDYYTYNNRAKRKAVCVNLDLER